MHPPEPDPLPPLHGRHKWMAPKLSRQHGYKWFVLKVQHGSIATLFLHGSNSLHIVKKRFETNNFLDLQALGFFFWWLIPILQIHNSLRQCSARTLQNRLINVMMHW